MIPELKRLTQAFINLCELTISIKASVAYSYLIIASLFFLIVSCGGSESTTPPPITTTPPPVIITTPVYGLLNLSNPEVTLVITEDRSYLFSAANNNTVPPSELMCTTEESFEEFSDTLTNQTLNFNCSGTNTVDQSIVAELEGENLNLKYIDGSEHDQIIELADIIKLELPNFSNVAWEYSTRVRNDINISRFIVVNSGSILTNFNIFSRDWPIGGDCLTSRQYRVYEPIFEVNQTYESILANYSGSSFLPSQTYCNKRTLPMPSPGEPIAARFYTLENGSYFLSMEQDNFVTMGVISK